jgi:hypothetical protein
MPAPPPESLPAMVSTEGTAMDDLRLMNGEMVRWAGAGDGMGLG